MELLESRNGFTYSFELDLGFNEVTQVSPPHYRCIETLFQTSRTAGVQARARCLVILSTLGTCTNDDSIQQKIPTISLHSVASIDD